MEYSETELEPYKATFIKSMCYDTNFGQWDEKIDHNGTIFSFHAHLFIPFKSITSEYYFLSQLCAIKEK